MTRPPLTSLPTWTISRSAVGQRRRRRAGEQLRRVHRAPSSPCARPARRSARSTPTGRAVPPSVNSAVADHERRRVRRLSPCSVAYWFFVERRRVPGAATRSCRWRDRSPVTSSFGIAAAVHERRVRRPRPATSSLRRPRRATRASTAAGHFGDARPAATVPLRAGPRHCVPVLRGVGCGTSAFRRKYEQREHRRQP